MKRIKSKITKISIAVFLIFALLFFIESTSVNAQDLESISNTVDESFSDTTITPRAALCPDCGRGFIVITYGSWSSWYTIGQVSCTHYPWGTDLKQERIRTVTQKCDYCGVGFSSTQKETQIVCHGYKN